MTSVRRRSPRTLRPTSAAAQINDLVGQSVDAPAERAPRLVPLLGTDGSPVTRFSALAFRAMTDKELIALEHENWIAYLTGV